MSAGRNFRCRNTLALTAAFGVLMLLAACSRNKEIEYKEQSVYEIYSQALGYLDDGHYKEAAQYFDEVERQHPYSVWATKAKLMAAYAQYQNNKYDDAITSLDRFIAVHPGNRDVAYAYYLKALCYYEQISDVQRDQELTRKALDSLQDVVTRFPGTVYARDARLKIDLTRDHLAGKEMAIARFYERRVQYLAAINRYKGVVDQYGDTSHVPEALERLTECFMELGLVTEAHKAAAVLGYNYPGSDWYRDAYRLAKDVPVNPGHPLVIQADATTPSGKAPATPAAPGSAPPIAGTPAPQSAATPPSTVTIPPPIAPQVAQSPAASNAAPAAIAPAQEASGPAPATAPQAVAPEAAPQQPPAKQKNPWDKLW